MHFKGSRKRRAPERGDGLPKVDPDELAEMVADHKLWVESDGAEGKRLVLNEVDLEGVQLKGAILNNADFSKSFLFGARLEEAHLSNATLEFANLSHAKLTKADLRHANLSGANFRDAKARGADFGWANLSYADVRRLVMSDAKVYGAMFLGTRGLFGRTRAITGDVLTGQALNDHAAIYTYERDFLHWPLLRSIGTLRLFGVSYAAFIVITIYGTFLGWYNERATALSEWAARDGADEAGVWVESLSQLPVPAHLGWQLLMIGLLAIGATLYQVRCPEFIRENTETRWTRELNQPLIEYRSAACSAIISRYICFICYLVGGTYTLGYLVWRGFNAIRYLVTG